MYSQLPEENPHLIRLRFSGHVSTREYKEICALLTSAVEKHETVDLLVEFDASFTRPSFPVLWQGARIASANLINLRRVAVVGEQRSYKWARVLVRGFHAETRYFDPGHRTRALRWLEKGPAYEQPREHTFAGDASYRIQRSKRPGLNSKRRHLLLLTFFALLSAGCLLRPIVSAQETAEPDEKQHHSHGNWLDLVSGDNAAKMRAAYQAAKEDPVVRAADERRKQAAKEYHEALRAAMLKRDPSLKPLLDRIPDKKLEQVLK